MWNKVMWLFLWVTLAFWVGCAGENHNHRGYEDRSPMFHEATPDKTFKGADQATEPSVLGVTRENWSTVQVGADSGRVPHHPIYFKERGSINNFHWHVAPDRPSPLTSQGIDIGYEVGAATHGNQMVFNDLDIEDALLSPIKFMYDLGRWPLSIYEQPINEVVWTPETPETPETPKCTADCPGCTACPASGADEETPEASPEEVTTNTPRDVEPAPTPQPMPKPMVKPAPAYAPK